MVKLADISLFESYQKSINNSFTDRRAHPIEESKLPELVQSLKGKLVPYWCKDCLFAGDPLDLMVAKHPIADEYYIYACLPEAGCVRYSDVMYPDAFSAIEDANEIYKKYSIQSSTPYISNRVVKNESVADISQLGESIINGYAQSDAGSLPQDLYNELTRLTDTLVEGMSIAYNRLKDAKDTSINQAECELFMDMQRRYCDKIPHYAKKAQGLFLKDY